MRRNIVPSRHHFAKFNVTESNGNYHFDFKSSDSTEIIIDAKETKLISDKSIFKTLNNASDFFKFGDLGYSPNKDKFVGLVNSSSFENEDVCTKESVKFDNAMLMTNIEHECKSETDK